MARRWNLREALDPDDHDGVLRDEALQRVATERGVDRKMLGAVEDWQFDAETDQLTHRHWFDGSTGGALSPGAAAGLSGA